MVKPRHGGSVLAPGWWTWTSDAFCGSWPLGNWEQPAATVTSQACPGTPASVQLLDTSTVFAGCLLGHKYSLKGENAMHGLLNFGCFGVFIFMLLFFAQNVGLSLYTKSKAVQGSANEGSKIRPQFVWLWMEAGRENPRDTWATGSSKSDMTGERALPLPWMSTCCWPWDVVEHSWCSLWRTVTCWVTWKPVRGCGRKKWAEERAEERRSELLVALKTIYKGPRHSKHSVNDIIIMEMLHTWGLTRAYSVGMAMGT